MNQPWLFNLPPPTKKKAPKQNPFISYQHPPQQQQYKPLQQQFQTPKKQRRSRLEEVRIAVSGINNEYYKQFKCQDAIIADLANRIGRIRQIVGE